MLASTLHAKSTYGARPLRTTGKRGEAKRSHSPWLTSSPGTTRWLLVSEFRTLSIDSADKRLHIGRPYVSNFSIPGEIGLAEKLHGVPQFVTAVGGAYFFLTTNAPALPGHLGTVNPSL